MRITPLELPGLLLIKPVRHGDERGFFAEVFRRDVFEAHAGKVDFVQDNHAKSAKRGTLRGLHCQKPPNPQGKLVRVVSGAVLDVVVDIRRGSPAFGKSLAIELSAENGLQLWVPPGFLHGYCALQEETEFLYKVTSYYAPEDDRGVRFDDPDIGITWPLPPAELTLSAKDIALPRLRDTENWFTYEG